ncbi:MAG: tRNA-splicing endonuclease [archaeon GW2011_AR13]|nr:MAG: tRNA-splicing endonuclease [archaeon GW2011_AR13]HIG94408.1 tRNA-intron lyase [Nanoarchaeota archaeon]HIH63553.1 tRNA-intron lyase [Nanoarchaeota archaeon]HIJ09348.1 tRNA-intron lyase [Nanoarchaeota archaeon]
MEKIKAYITGEIISTNDSEAHALYNKSRFGELVQNKIQYSLPEALYLTERNKIEIYFGKKILNFEGLMEKLKKIDKKIHIKYLVFKDLRDKGYTVKTALKFGAEFRIYEKGKKPGIEHAKWIVFTDHESNKLTWHEFSAKNRVAHSTKKNLLLAILDEEGSITYYEVKWIKP